MKNKRIVRLIESYQQDKGMHQTIKCRFIPTCSEYSKQCYMKFNFVKASFLTLKRCCKCNPLFKGGFDPVPLTKEEKRLQKLEEEMILNENEEANN